jgi:kynurenine formamidase
LSTVSDLISLACCPEGAGWRFGVSGQTWGVAEHRAVFDFRITFVNGGEITGRDFRLDVPSRDVDPSAVGLLLVRHLGLLMVDRVELDPFRIIEEPHRGGRGLETAVVADRRIVELSHPIRHGMVTYPGLPGPEITDHLTRAAAEQAYGPEVTFHIGRISMVANTGTYLDSSFHRYADGADLAGTTLDRLVDLEGVVVRVAGSPARAVDAPQLTPLEVTGRAVLVHTGWDRHWESPAYGQANPYLTRAAAQWLVDHKAALVAIDSVNIDDVEDRTRPAHSILLAAGIPIVEHLCGLDQLPPQGFHFHAAPPAIEGLGTFPVRAYAIIDTTH